MKSIFIISANSQFRNIFLGIVINLKLKFCNEVYIRFKILIQLLNSKFSGNNINTLVIKALRNLNQLMKYAAVTKYSSEKFHSLKN